MDSKGQLRDEVDAIVDFWLQENPQLDRTTKTLAIRLRRAGHHLERALRQELALLDMEMWEAEVLVALRRGQGCRLSAGDLLRESHVTSGAITNRVAQLEKRGWVRRDHASSDRRQVLVSLTPDGIARADELLAMKTQAESALFAGLSQRVRERLSDDLRSLLLSLEGPVKPEDEAALHMRQTHLSPA